MKQYNNITIKSGFTLIELMLVIGLMGAIAAFSTPIYQNFQVKNDLDIAVSNISQSLYRAQALSRASSGDSAWGLKIQSGSIVVFRGTSYSAPRDTSHDEQTNLYNSITPSGDGEIVFDKLSGNITTNKSITLTSTIGTVKSININTKGMVDF